MWGLPGSHLLMHPRKSRPGSRSRRTAANHPVIIHGSELKIWRSSEGGHAHAGSTPNLPIPPNQTIVTKTTTPALLAVSEKNLARFPAFKAQQFVPLGGLNKVRPAVRPAPSDRRLQISSLQLAIFPLPIKSDRLYNPPALPRTKSLLFSIVFPEHIHPQPTQCCLPLEEH